MLEQYEGSVKRYLVRLEEATNGSVPSAQMCADILDQFLATVEAPTPDIRVRAYFCNTDILLGLTDTLFTPFSKSLHDAINRVVQRQGRRRVGRFLRVRQLGSRGRYPNQEFADRWGRYTIRAGIPYLLTFNSAREERRWSCGSELSDWTRHETRLATSISCTESGGFSPYLTNRIQDIPISSVGHVPRESRVDFMIEYASLVEYIRKRKHRPYRDGNGEWRAPFDFGDFTPFQQSARKFAAKFLVGHSLLLRTARHYVKAMMLWRVEGLEEDAVANVFFALEGCLLLFQEIHDMQNEKLDRRLLRRLFSDVYEHGDGFYDFIDDAMGWGGTRARIVHPQLAFTDGWKPRLSAEDYFEYRRIVCALLVYIVSGSTFWDYELRQEE